MQAEMNKLFAEGGVMQEGGTVDPVSGNDVPPGAMAEEVRDDIPAQLSEGEFVMPADVVRYWGLEKLMAMRDKAKMGLKKMEEIGQMGNAEEVPDGEALHGGEDEMDEEAFSSEIDSILGEEGGEEEADVGDERKYKDGGYVVPENQATYRDAPIKGFEMVPLTNDAGQTIYIPYIDGVAQLSVPAGYKVKTSAVTATPAVDGGAGTGVPDTGGGTGGDGGGGGGNTDGSTPGGGQGISNTAIGAGLAAMAIGQSTLGKAVSAVMGLPVSTLANLGGIAVVDAQIDAIGKSMDAMTAAQSSNIAGQVATVSDASGNISTVSNQGITDAFDSATFGTTSAAISAESVANNIGQEGLGVGTGVGVGGTGAAPGETGVSAVGEANAGGPAPGTGNGSDSGNDGGGGVGAGNAGGGIGAGEGLAKGGFVSKPANTTKQKGLAGRRK